MDRRNGGDPLAPPRPPKLLPRVHRPRAPEPTAASTMSDSATTKTTTAATTPQCTNSTNNNNNNHSRSHIVSGDNNNHHNISSTSNNSSQQQQQHFQHSIKTNLKNNNSNSSNNAVVTAQPALQQQQLLTTPLLQLQQQQYRGNQQLSRNNSNLSNASASTASTTASSISAANSFTRRRPPPPTPTLQLSLTPSPLTLPAANYATTSNAAIPLLTIVNGNIISGSLLQNSHSNEPPPPPVSPVTLAAPRPETERLTNEYVETPFRTVQQLQQASRSQHPAGQNAQGQTTTQHSLLLQQSQSRQHQQQQQQQQQQHSSRVGAAAGSAANNSSATFAATLLHANAFLHSNSHKTSASAAAATTTIQTTSATKLPASHAPPPPQRPHALSGALPITQPIITKQPAASASSHFTKDSHVQPHTAAAFLADDLLDLHGGGLSTPPGSSMLTRSGSALGTPIIIGGIDAAALNPITCPRCDRCRCEQCQSPRQLPQTWVCNKSCLCSAETIIDYASCLCCAKALFYHCAKDQELDCDDGATTLCVDDPCSCLPHKRAQRWGWLGALSLVLPCLWCYWPMRGCAALCEKCYGRYAGHGCRCQQIGSTSSMLPIVPLGISGTGSNGINGGNNGTQNGSSDANTKSSTNGGGHHHRHHSECSAASRILRKCDLTPEKRLLDSSPEY